jgi:DNA repair photolyase
MVDLGAHLLRLVSPLRPGDPLVDGWTLVGASTELGLRLSFAAADAPEHPRLHVELAPADAPGPHAVATARLHLSYRSPAASPVPSATGLRLCEAVARLVRANEACVLDDIARHAAAEPDDGPRIREVTVERLLEPAGDAAAPFDTLSPYVGCLVGCRFCYAQSRLSPLRRLLGLPPTPWGSWVDVRVNAPEVLRQELHGRPPRPIKLCPIVADPYQAVERRHRLTRACLDVLLEATPIPPVLVLTRMAALAEDLPRLARLPRAFVGVSLPTVDDEVRRSFEPRAATVHERLALLDAVRAAGVHAIAVVQPLLPGPHDALVEALAARADSVSVDVLRGEEGARALFDDPRYRAAREDAWQRERATRLADELRARGVAVWHGELPPPLRPERPEPAGPGPEPRS